MAEAGVYLMLVSVSRETAKDGQTTINVSIAAAAQATKLEIRGDYAYTFDDTV